MTADDTAREREHRGREGVAAAAGVSDARAWGGAIACVALYVVLCLVPMGVAMLTPLPEGRGFWVEFGVALGFVALAMMGGQFALTARFASISRRIGQDTLLQFHRVAGMSAAAMTFSHPIVLILADRTYAEFFDPRVNLMRAGALSAACGALVLLIVLSVFRARLAIAYEWWRVTHAGLAALVMLVGLAHVLNIRHYASTPLKAVMLAAIIGVPLGLLAHVRLVRPLRLRRRPYRVVSVQRECERVWTVTLEAEVGVRRLTFEPGQFAWVTFGNSPLRLRQHPFTIASSADDPRLAFTIKELGDFTRTIGTLAAGSRAFVEGPAGNLRLDRTAPGAMMIAGGIGITPMMSILRTMRDRRDRRPVLLLYATSSLDTAVFAEELAELRKELSLDVVHVLESPPPGWDGPSGFITREMVRGTLPLEELRTRNVLICGPDPMMDVVERALLDVGVSRWRMRSERFNVV